MTYEINTSDGPAIQSPYGAILLADLFVYGSEDGILRWKERPLKWCQNFGTWKWWNGRFANRLAGSLRKDGYIAVLIFQHPMKAHRIAFAMGNGAWPCAQIDHANHIRNDNRFANLTDVSQAENARNHSMKSTNKTGVNGVCWDAESGKWLATIRDKALIKLGRFANFDDAVAARRMAEIRVGYHENHGANRGVEA